jgi:ion channel-forming bestrophin family protein
MINYNPKAWLSLFFRLHKADTFRKLIPLMLCIAVYAAAIAWMEINWLHIAKGGYVANLTVMHSLLGFVISMLLVFRTNTAYDRWWEGRKLWGNLVNNSRNLSIKLAAMLPKEAVSEKHFFKKAIPAFAHALHHHLLAEKTRVQLFDYNTLPEPLRHIANESHPPNKVAAVIYEHVYQLYNKGIIRNEALIVLNAEVQSLCDISGACERIKNTPIPFSYNVFIKKFLFIYIGTMPFGFAPSLGYLVIPVVTIIFYVLVSLELIAEEIEDPFGGDANDVPTDKIVQTIQNNVAALLD